MEKIETIEDDARQLTKKLLGFTGGAAGQATILYSSNLSPLNSWRNSYLQYKFEATKNYLLGQEVISVIEETSIRNPYVLYGDDVPVTKVRVDVIKAKKYLGEPLAERGTENRGQGSLPKCVRERGIGYLKFGKYAERKKIGKVDSRPFRFLEFTVDTLGQFRSLDSVFGAIRIEEDNQDSKLNSQMTAQTRKIQIIENSAIKELQKGKKLEDNKSGRKIKFEFNADKTFLKAVLVD